MNYQETLNRLNTLLGLLNQHSEASMELLIQSLNVSRVTLNRDIERLQNLGHNIEYCRKRRAYVLLE
ncbi:HTH domain-containing protein [Haliscomenobacter sp.]|uniref:HTH domain-containing protein n=1 Tax=Haliscomenobacter sp. TaxID=2717303 RepID=UPI003364DF67